jgi:hypothetical protein
MCSCAPHRSACVACAWKPGVLANCGWGFRRGRGRDRRRRRSGFERWVVHSHLVHSYNCHWLRQGAMPCIVGGTACHMSLSPPQVCFLLSPPPPPICSPTHSSSLSLQSRLDGVSLPVGSQLSAEEASAVQGFDADYRQLLFGNLSDLTFSLTFYGSYDEARVEPLRTCAECTVCCACVCVWAPCWVFVYLPELLPLKGACEHVRFRRWCTGLRRVSVTSGQVPLQPPPTGSSARARTSRWHLGTRPPSTPTPAAWSSP